MSHAHIPAARKGSDSEIIALSRQAAKDLVQVPSSRARSKSMDESQMEDESDCDSDRLRMIEARLFELNSEAFGRAHERDEAEHGSENALLKSIEELLLGRVRLDDAQHAAQCAEHDAGVTAGSSGGAFRVGMQPRTQHPSGRQALGIVRICPRAAGQTCISSSRQVCPALCSFLTACPFQVSILPEWCSTVVSCLCQHR